MSPLPRVVLRVFSEQRAREVPERQNPKPRQFLTQARNQGGRDARVKHCSRCNLWIYMPGWRAGRWGTSTDSTQTGPRLSLCSATVFGYCFFFFFLLFCSCCCCCTLAARNEVKAKGENEPSEGRRGQVLGPLSRVLLPLCPLVCHPFV